MWVCINVNILRVRKGYIGTTSQTAFFITTMKKVSYNRIKLNQKLVVEAGLFLQSTLSVNIWHHQK